MGAQTNDTSGITNLLAQYFAPGRTNTETTSSSLSSDQAYALAQRMMGGVNGLASVQAQQRAGGMRGSSSAYFGTNNLLSNIAADVAARNATTTKTSTSAAPNLGVGGNLAGAYALAKFLDPNGEKLKGIGDWIFGGSSPAQQTGPSLAQMGGSYPASTGQSGMDAIMSFLTGSSSNDANPGELLAAASQGSNAAGVATAASSADPTAGGFFNSDPTGVTGSFNPLSIFNFLNTVQDLGNNYSEKNQAPTVLAGIGGITGGLPGMQIGKAVGESSAGQDLSAGIYHVGQVLPEVGDKSQEGWDKASGGVSNSWLSQELNNFGSGLGSAANDLGGGLNDLGSSSGVNDAVSGLGSELSNFGSQVASLFKW